MGSGTNDALARAVDYLGAVEVAPGRYAAKDGTAWYTMPEAILTDSHPFLRRESVEMPSWWTPEQRKAWRVTVPKRARFGVAPSKRYPTEAEAVKAAGYLWSEFVGWRKCVERITADLTTGEEVPA